MFRHCHVILRQPAINTFTVHLLSFCTMNQKMHTIIPQIITLLHVSTLSCHPQTACNQYFAQLHRYIPASTRVASTYRLYIGPPYEEWLYFLPVFQGFNDIFVIKWKVKIALMRRLQYLFF